MGTSERLARRLGTGDAVLIGLGSMIGVGVFAVFAPAAAAAGSWLLGALAIAAVVAYCNATSAARLVAVVLGVLAAVVIAGTGAAWSPMAGSLTAGAPTAVLPDGTPPMPGLLQAAGLLFFAFAGYARITTLGEDVRDPARIVPRAIPLALGITLLCYAAVAATVLGVLGPDRLAAAEAPLVETVFATGVGWLVPVVQVGAALATLGALLALILGVSRTTLAMARDGHLPRWLTAVHPRFGVPHHAGLAVGAVVALLATSTDLRGAIGFSSFGVLVYYAIANAAALTLTRPEGSPPRLVGILGLAGCLALAATLPLPSILSGLAVLFLGVMLYLVRRKLVRIARFPPVR